MVAKPTVEVVSEPNCFFLMLQQTEVTWGCDGLALRVQVANYEFETS
jgi:hypothetical protein